MAVFYENLIFNFSLFNGQNTRARALALAHRAVKETKNDDDAITRLFALVFARSPRSAELENCREHWNVMTSLVGGAKPMNIKPPLEVRRDAVEENTGERFAFTERLHAAADFQPDLAPADDPKAPPIMNAEHLDEIRSEDVRSLDMNRLLEDSGESAPSTPPPPDDTRPNR